MNNQTGYTMKDLSFWKIVIGLGIASIFIFSAMYAFQPLLPVLQTEFQISVSYASLTISATTTGLIVGLVVFGFLSDRYGRSFAIKFSIICSTIPFFFMPSLTAFFWMILLRFIQGFTIAGLLAASLAYLNEEIHPKYVSFATALYISSNGLGGMIGRFVIGFLVEQTSWQFLIYILGATGIVTFCLLIISLPSSRQFQPSQETFLKDVEGFIFHLKNPELLMIFGFGIVLQFSFTGIWTFLPFHLLEPPYQLSLQAISFTYLAYGFGVVGAPIAGWLASRFGLQKVRIAGVVTLASGIVITLADALWLLVIGLCFVCLGFFTAHSLTAASVTREATHHKGSASSLYLVAYYIGVTFGSTLLSFSWEWFGWISIIAITASLPLLYLLMMMKTSK